MRTYIPFLALLALTPAAHAAWPAGSKPALPPPPLPSAEAAARAEAQQNNALEPQVTIKHEGTTTVEEYRTNGRLYMIKITPSKGYPYYLIDTNGDGRFDTRRNELENPPINQWILYRW